MKLSPKQKELVLDAAANIDAEECGGCKTVELGLYPKTQYRTLYALKVRKFVKRMDELENGYSVFWDVEKVQSEVEDAP